MQVAGLFTTLLLWAAIAASPATAAIGTDLVAFWPGDEASGSLIDAHSTNDLAELSGTLDAATVGGIATRTWVNGETEVAYASDASWNDFSTGDFTICGLVRHTSLASSFMTIFQKDRNAGSARETIMYHQSSGSRYHFIVSNSGGTTDLSLNSFGAPSTDTWYFFCVWYNAAAQTINGQINNGAVDSTSHTHGIRNGTGDFALGGTQNGNAGSTTIGNGLSGYLARVGVWRRVLNTNERTWLYNGGSGRTYAQIAAGMGGAAPVYYQQQNSAAERDRRQFYAALKLTTTHWSLSP